MKERRNSGLGRRESDLKIEQIVDQYTEMIHDLNLRWSFAFLGLLAGPMIALACSIFFPDTVYKPIIMDGVEIAREITFLPAFLGGFFGTLPILGVLLKPTNKWVILTFVAGLTNIVYWSVMISLLNKFPANELMIIGCGVSVGVLIGSLMGYGIKRDSELLKDSRKVTLASD